MRIAQCATDVPPPRNQTPSEPVPTCVRTLIFACSLLLTVVQTPRPATPAQTAAEARQALAGDWVGALEYRDYSEPPTSTKRVQLPTWLPISASGTHLTRHYYLHDC